MKKYFTASIIKHGIIGGGIVLDDEKLTFKTGKLTVPTEIKNLEINYADILAVTNNFKIMMPTVTIKLKDLREYSFIIFNKKGFLKMLKGRMN